VIIYSVLPPEWKLADLEDASRRFYESIDGIPVELVPVGENRVRVSRVMSTNPLDFLHPKVQPGLVLSYPWKERFLQNA